MRAAGIRVTAHCLCRNRMKNYEGANDPDRRTNNEG